MGKILTIKHQVRKLIDDLPENCTAEDIQYQLYLFQKIRKGEAALARGALSHDQVRRRAQAWRRK